MNILDGTTFFVCDGDGEVEPSEDYPTGLFSNDTRFLSRWRLSIDQEPVHALTVDELNYFENMFFLVPGRPTHYVDAKISAIRHRVLAGDLVEELTVVNHQERTVEVTVRIDMQSDFADIFDIKNVGERSAEVAVYPENDRLRLSYQRDAFHRQTTIYSSEPAIIDGQGMTFRVNIGPHGEWTTKFTVECAIFGAYYGSRHWRSDLAGCGGGACEVDAAALLIMCL